MTAVTLLAGGCAPGVSGVVRDAATERPIGGAVVDVRHNTWGIRSNQLVWDAEKISRTTTDGDGRFKLDSAGGHGLRVTAPGYPAVVTSLCARSPMIIRVGGPFAELSPDRRLLFRQEGSAGGASQTPFYLALIQGVAIRGSGGAFADQDELRLETDGGVRYVPGTGTIPRPPPMPYGRSVELDLRSDCGWLFVSNGGSPVAVIQVRPLGWEQEPGRSPRWVMLYNALSDH